MERTYWQRQTKEPLFPDLVWSRPENRHHAGKLLIVGGNVHGFAAPAEAYQLASKAGAGSTRVVLPLALRSVAGQLLETVEYLPATPSGSLASGGLDELLEQAMWADGLLLAGDLGRNSETAMLLEKFSEAYKGQLTLTEDAADYVVSGLKHIVERPATTLVLSFAQLQKLATELGLAISFTTDMDLLRLVDSVHDISEHHPAQLITKHLDNIVVASGGRVSTTPDSSSSWRVRTAAYASVWWLQNADKAFEALTTAIYESIQK